MDSAALRATSHDIYQDLHHQLLNGFFEPGIKIKPEDLRKTYGCSANTIRDVLLRLTSAGLTTFEEQRGFRTTTSTPEQRHDVARFRMLLEQEGAVQSMRYGGVAWQSRLTAAHHKLSHIERMIFRLGELADNVRLWSQVEWEFHDTLISACGSPLLRQSYRNAYDQFRQQMVTQERDFGTNYFESIIAEHQAILDAALGDNEDACRDAIFQHLRRNFIKTDPAAFLVG
jgi:DNA-binding GntR family transcriptional regulator